MPATTRRPTRTFSHTIGRSNGPAVSADAGVAGFRYGPYCLLGVFRRALPALAGDAAISAVGARLRARSGVVVGLGILCVTIAGLSLLWPHSLTYDPWSWVLWGREIVHGSLSTAGGSSWKPLPVIFDSLFSLFGGAAPDLWLVLARAGALMSLVFGYRLAARCAGPLCRAAGRDRGCGLGRL